MKRCASRKRSSRQRGRPRCFCRPSPIAGRRPKAAKAARAPNAGRPKRVARHARAARKAARDAKRRRGRETPPPSWRVQLRNSAGDLITVTVDDRNSGVRRLPDPLAGNRAAQWIRWIHDGSRGGPVWQFVVFLTGVFPVVFAVTGDPDVAARPPGAQATGERADASRRKTGCRRIDYGWSRLPSGSSDVLSGRAFFSEGNALKPAAIIQPSTVAAPSQMKKATQWPLSASRPPGRPATAVARGRRLPNAAWRPASRFESDAARNARARCADRSRQEAQQRRAHSAGCANERDGASAVSCLRNNVRAGNRHATAPILTRMSSTGMAN